MPSQPTSATTTASTTTTTTSTGTSGSNPASESTATTWMAKMNLGSSSVSDASSQTASFLFESSPWVDGSSVQQSLPAGYHIRPLHSQDDQKGFLQLLAQLTQVGDVSPAMFLDRFQFMKNRAGDYFTTIIEDEQKRIVASGTIFVERKFIRQCGSVGHIEDIVVDANQRGKNLGRKIIDQLTHIGKLAGCYKVILCCDEKNQGFYEKCGYAKKEVEMVLYLNK